MTLAPDTERRAGEAPTRSPALDAQALIREARARQRKRRLGFALVVALVTAGGIYLGSGGFSPGGPYSAPLGPSGPVVARAGLARVSFTWRSTRVGGCVPATGTGETTGTGSIDLRNHRMAYVARSVGCLFASVHPVRPTPTFAATRWIGTTTYTAGAGTPWKEGSGAHTGSLGSISDLMISPWALTVAELPGTVLNAAGSGTVDGEPATKYVGTTTLLAIRNELRTVFGPHRVVLSPTWRYGGYVPAPGAIPISLIVWRDAQGRVLRITAVQPLYTASYGNSADVEGPEMELAEQVPIATLGLVRGDYPPQQAWRHTKLVRLTTLRQQSAIEVTLTLSSYGTAATINTP